eukprot:Amastigsp_a185000_4.p3 type:complete len:130 gc:universal Amastigsp_a185000_4:300-689(+)
MAAARKPARPRSCSSTSAMRLVAVKMMMRSRGFSAATLMTRSNLDHLSFFEQQSMICVTSAFARMSSMPPTAMRIADEPTQSSAMRRTSTGHVAEKKSICRSGRICAIIDRSCGSKPMSSMRSASSSTT